MNLVNDRNNTNIIAPYLQEKKDNFSGGEFDKLMVGDENLNA